MLAGSPVLEWVKTPVVVPPSAKQLVVGLAVVPQHVPLAVSAAPPSEVTLAPNVAEEEVTALEVGVVTVGAVLGSVISSWIFGRPGSRVVAPVLQAPDVSFSQ